VERKNLIITGVAAGVGLLLVFVAFAGQGRFHDRGERAMSDDRNDRSEMNYPGKSNKEVSQTVMSQKNAVEAEYVVDPSDYINTAEYINDTPVSALSEVEIAGLLLMREEEKLARDVYTILGDKWGIKVFSNIAGSEQTHMNAVGDLIKKYNLTDPVVDTSIGVFTNPDLQKLYTELTERGLTSSAEALQVGALIEDLDIYDLERLIGETYKTDIISVYQNLQKGSRNHLRAFTKQITRSGGEYVPEYILQADYQSILGGAQERGRI
jgi:hypothetical protein